MKAPPVLKAVLLLLICGPVIGQNLTTPKPATCAKVEGTFNNIGDGDERYWKSHRLPPTLWLGVLSRKPPRDISAVLVETVDDDHLRFQPKSSSGTLVSPPLEIAVACRSGWRSFTRTTEGGAEGFRGTVTREVQLSLADDGSILVRVSDKFVGRDFFILPHSSLHEFQFRFPKSVEQRN